VYNSSCHLLLEVLRSHLRSGIRTANGLMNVQYFWPAFTAFKAASSKNKLVVFVFWLKFDDMDHHTNTLIMGFLFCFVFLCIKHSQCNGHMKLCHQKKVIVVKFFSYNNLYLLWVFMFSKLVVETTKD